VKRILTISAVLILSIGIYGQGEVITNAQVVEMTKAGLSSEIILKKISSTISNFVVSTNELIELRKAGVDNSVITAMMKRRSTSIRPLSTDIASGVTGQPTVVQKTAREMVLNANTIALQKSSLNPSRQALEKELLKRPDWRALNLTIDQYRDNADLYIDVGVVPLSLLTHRYVYRIYDRRSGAILAAGETTSWGSLAENLARHISRSLAALRS